MGPEDRPGCTRSATIGGSLTRAGIEHRLDAYPALLAQREAIGAVLGQLVPSWREARAGLNELARIVGGEVLGRSTLNIRVHGERSVLYNAVVFARQAGRLLAGRVVGKGIVRAMVVFLTNDLAAVRVRHRLLSPRQTFSTADEPLTTQGVNRSRLHWLSVHDALHSE